MIVGDNITLAVDDDARAETVLDMLARLPAEGIAEKMAKEGVIEDWTDTLPVYLGGIDVNDSRSCHIDGAGIGNRSAQRRLRSDIRDEIQHRIRITVKSQYQCSRHNACKNRHQKKAEQGSDSHILLLVVQNHTEPMI